jgi:hypothetical protein
MRSLIRRVRVPHRAFTHRVRPTSQRSSLNFGTEREPRMSLPLRLLSIGHTDDWHGRTSD